MYSVIETEDFSDWLEGLKDRPTRIRLVSQLDKVRRGILGDVKPVCEGVFEMREFSAPTGTCTTQSAPEPSSSCSAGATDPARPRTLNTPYNWQRSCDGQDQHPAIRRGQLPQG